MLTFLDFETFSVEDYEHYEVISDVQVNQLHYTYLFSSEVDTYNDLAFLF